MTEQPLSRQFMNSCCALAITAAGSMAGPALKLNTCFMSFLKHCYGGLPDPPVSVRPTNSQASLTAKKQAAHSRSFTIYCPVESGFIRLSQAHYYHRLLRCLWLPALHHFRQALAGLLLLLRYAVTPLHARRQQYESVARPVYFDLP